MLNGSSPVQHAALQIRNGRRGFAAKNAGAMTRASAVI